MDIGALALYGATLLSYFFIYNILAWGLNIQFGLAGIPMFTYITFFAAGAYVTGVLTLPPAGGPNQSLVYYILGWHLPFPLPLIGGGLAAGLFAALIGVLTLRRLRRDYLAIVYFAVGFIILDLVSASVPVFNGFEGLAGVQPPLNNVLQLDYNTYTYFFIAIAALVMIAAGFVVFRVQRSALGRTLRAIRDDPDVAEALGKDTFRFRLLALVVGAVFAGVAGGLTIEFVGAFNPTGWAAPETFIVFAAVLIGGKANNWGVVLGSLLVPTLLFQGVAILIPISTQYPLLVSGLRFMLVGAVIIVMMWVRPEGILPEPRRRFPEPPLGDLASVVMEAESV